MSNLMCQECRGTGRVTEEYILGWPLKRPCGYCGGSGEVTPANRGAWLRQRRVKRQRDAIRAKESFTP